MTASNIPTNLPSSCKSIPISARNLIVRGLCNLAVIVRKPVAIADALSRVVALILVYRASNSLRLPPAASKTPPALLITSIKSPDSTAKLPATALIELRTPSKSLASNLNCLIAAIAPSLVFSILSKVGARLDFASASSAVLVSLADRPVCAKIREMLTSSPEETPRPVDNLNISPLNPETPSIVFPVTCCTFNIWRLKSIAAFTPCLKLATIPTTIPAGILKARKRRMANADCLPNSPISLLATFMFRPNA